MTVEHDNNICGLDKNSKIELGFAKVNVESESKVYVMHKKGKMEVTRT